MSNKTKSRFLRNRTLSRLAALGGTAIIVSSLLMTVVATTASAAGTGAKLPTTAGTATWTNPTNAFTNNGQDATVRPAAGATVTQSYGTFGFPTLPPGSIIDGITVNIEANITDASGCSIVVTLDGGDTVRSKTLALTATATTPYTLGSATDPWGTSGTDWDPTQLTNANFTARLGAVDGDSCNDTDPNNNQATFGVDYFDVTITYRTIDAHAVSNPALDDTVCDAANFNFVIDMSGSIAAQGNIPSNLPDMIAGINGFVADFEASGSGKYAATRFNAGAASNLTAGYVSAATFTPIISALSNPNGLTPTQLGIDTADGNIANPGPGQQIMFVITDGSPNVPNTHGDDLTNPETWLQGANGAIGAADVARVPMVVKAFYVSDDGPPADPGDTNLPFSPAGDSQWAQAVMTEIGGGSFLPGDFDTFKDELFKAIHCEPDIKVEKSGNGTITSGQQAAYTITVTNIGDGTAHDVELIDDLPAGIVWAEDSPECSIDTGANPDRLNCNFEDMIAGEVETIHLTGTTDSGDCGAHRNTASATSSNEPDNVLGNNQASATITVICADLDLTKTPDAVSVSAGSQIGFVVTIENKGAGTASGLSFSDALPGGSGVSWSIAAPSAGWSISGSAPTQSLVYSPTTLAGNTSTSVHVISGTTKDSCKAYVNNASVSSTNDGSDTAQATTTVNCASLDLSKTPDAVSVSAGSQIGFAVTIANNGAGTATGLSFSDALPSGTGVDWSIATPSAGWSISGSAPNQSLVYSPTTLAGNSSTSVHVISATTKDSCKAYVNNASVSATNDGSDTAQATTTVNCPSLDLTKTPDAVSVSAGSPIGFTVTIANNGAGTATGLSFSDALPGGTGIDWSIATPSAGWSISGTAPNQSLVYTPTTLAGNSSTSVHVVSATTKDSCKAYPNSASVSATNDGSDQAQATTTVNCPSLDLTKTPDAVSASAGSQIGFVVTIANNGAGTATGLSFSDALPGGAGVNWSIATPSAGWSISGSAPTQSLVYTPTTLAGNSSTSVHVISATSKDSCKAYINSASVSAGNAGSDQATATTTVNCADIAISKVADDDSVSAGDDIGFKITVTNIGLGAATGVHVEDELPTDPGLNWSAGAPFGPDAAGVTCGIVAGILTCDVASLPSGGSFSVHISSPTTAATVATSPVENTATVTTTNDGDDTSTDEVEVLGANIGIVKEADKPIVNAGESIGFKVTISNSGPGQAKNVHVTDTLPTDDGLNWTLDDDAGGLCKLDGGVVTCDKETLDKDASFSFHVTSTTTAATAEDSPVENSACVKTTNDGEGCSGDEVEVLGADIQIAKVADDDVVNAGEDIGFTITVRNNGDGTATGVHVSDLLPTDNGLNWSAGAPFGPDAAGVTCGILAGSLTCDIASLPSDGTFSVHISSPTTWATAASSPVENTAKVETTNDGKDESTDDVEVLAPNIQVDKEADHDVVNAGETIGFKVTISNSGPGQAKAVVVTDELPTDAGLSWILDDDAGGLCTLKAGVVTCKKDTLDKNETFSFHVTSTTTAATVEDSPVANEACVTAGNQAGGDCDDDETEVLGADITVIKQADDDAVAAGESIGFKVTISNNGEGQAKNVHVTDTLPTDAGLSWTLDDNAGGLCELDGGVVTCDKATLDSGASFSFHVTSTTTAATAETSPVENTACVETSNDGQACGGDEVGVSSLVIDKSNNAPIDEELDIPSAPVGSTVTYTLDYTFAGHPVTNGLIEDVLPEGVEYIADTATDSDEFVFQGYDSTTRTLTWKAEEVTNSGSLTYQAKVQEEAEGFGPLINVATISSDQTDQDDAQSEIFVPTIPEAETSKPTPPQTDVFVGEGGVAGPGISLLVMFAILGGLIVGLAFITPVPEVVRRRNRR